MPRQAPIVKIVSPAAAAFLWQISDARLRRLALDGAMPYRRIRGWGRKGSRAYLFDACCDRWGSPDPDRLALLQTVSLLQVSGKGGVIWELTTPMPVVLDQDGDLATTFEKDEK